MMPRYLALLLTLALLPGCDNFFSRDACRLDADCDDADACTVDECTAFTGVCTNDPVDCQSGLVCDSDTGLCAVSDGDEAPSGSPELKRFESEEDLASYFRGQIAGRNSEFFGLDEVAEPVRSEADGDELAMEDSLAPNAGAAPPDADGGAGSGEAAEADPFSETTIQEEGVDEADVVKTDGTYLYIINDAVLRIVQVSPPEEMTLLGEVSLKGFGREIYLHGNRVIALTQTYGGFFYFDDVGVPEPGIVEVEDSQSAPTDVSTESPADEPAVAPGELEDAVLSESVAVGVDVAFDQPMSFARPQTFVTVIDVSAPAEARILSQTAFDGSQASSRMINGVLHLVLANYQDYYYDVLPLLGQGQLDLSEVDVESLLPRFETIEGEGIESDGPVVAWEDMFRPTDADGFGVVTVVSMDVEAPADFKAVGIVAEPGLIYSSLEALYLTDADYGVFSGSRFSRQTTDIYKLEYSEGGVVPVATGTVPGRILNQHSMGEYQGYLRVATTVDAAFFDDFGRAESYNNVYVLGHEDTALEIVGSIENIAIGETVTSARFLGERGYVVTFKRVDPLHTLDLSDPTNPREVGTLIVPGFSTFIVPMDSDHLLTVGQYVPEDNPFAPTDVQLSIFDISDFSNPVLAWNKIIGADSGSYTGGYSEALNNPKAFTYFASAGLVALPISLYNYDAFIDDTMIEPVMKESDGEAPAANSEEVSDGIEVDRDETEPPDALPLDPIEKEDFEGLIVYRVSTENGFSELGRISTRFDELSYWWTAFTRGVFIGDKVFAVTNAGVRGAPVEDIESVPYELEFDLGDPFGDVETIEDGGVTSPGEAVETEVLPVTSPQAAPDRI